MASVVSALSIVGVACKLLLSCVFCHAGFHKLRDLNGFARILNDYGLGNALPRKWIALLLAVTELLLAASLAFIPAFFTLALYGVLLMLGVYVLVLLAVYASGKSLRDCGCGTRHSAHSRLTLWPIVRNVVLMLAAALLLVFSPAALTLVEWLMAISTAALLLMLYWTIEEMQSNRLLQRSLQALHG